MEQHGKSFLKWKLSLAETFGFAATVAMIVVWGLTFFQSRSDASETKAYYDAKFNKYESDQAALGNKVQGIAIDVSYIRGRVEPRTKGE